MPSTYAEWLPLLDRFAAGDDTTLAEMSSGTIEWTNVVAERMVRQVNGTLKQRLETLSTGFQKRLNRAASAVEVRAALSWGRDALSPLNQFANLPAFEERLRGHLNEECRKWVERTQSSLETSARLSKDDGALRLLQSSGLAWPPPQKESSPAGRSSDAAPAETPRSGPGRRVLL